MIALSRDVLRNVVSEARLAPSVHNVQPSRWCARRGRIELWGDLERSVPIADPAGRDWRLSLGAALEGFDLALSARGLGLGAVEIAPPAAASSPAAWPAGGRVLIAAAAVQPASRQDMSASVYGRVSWRGAFMPVAPEDEPRIDALAADRDDLLLVRDRDAISKLAVLGDRASMHFLRDDAHRRELLAWMRLARRHPAYDRDGLNADAMCLSAPEAMGASLVLGPSFKWLDRVGLAAALTSDAGKTRSAAAIALLLRPAGEDALVTGRAFYRAWLAMEQQGFKACPMSVLADWPVTNAEISRAFGVPGDRLLVSVFRLGVPRGAPSLVRARLPVDELIID